MDNYLGYLIGVLFLAISIVGYFYYKKQRLSRSKYLLKKALMYYKEKKYNQSVVMLRKGFVLPQKGIITNEEALLNVKNLELLDLILLKQNIDSDRLTLALRKLLNEIDKFSHLDKNYFYPITSFYKTYTTDQVVTQQKLDQIAKTHFLIDDHKSIQKELISEQEIVFA